MGVQEWHVTEPYVSSKCSLGEGPYYVPERHELRFMDINNHKLFVIDLHKGPESMRTIETGMPVGVTADIEGFDSSEIILTGAKDGVTKFNLNTSQHEYVAKYWSGPDAREKTRRFRSNDGAVDSAGRMFVEAFVDPEVEEPTAEAVTFRLDHDGSLKPLIEGSTIPNGISWTADDKTMYITETPAQTVYAYDFDPKSGGISNRRVHFRLKEEGVFPDGHALDVEGNIWHACFGGAKVVRISPQGEITGVIHLPTRSITCPVFVGTQLFITSGKESDPEKYPESAKNEGNLFKVDVGIKGMSKHKARLL